MSEDDIESFRSHILSEIDRRKRGQWRMSIPELMQLFGYTAARRVHQASLQFVLDLLAEWNVGFRLPGGTSAYDEIVLFRAAPVAVVPQAPTAAIETAGSTTKTQVTVTPLTLTLPLLELFTLDGLGNEERGLSRSRALHAALWALRPTCLFVDASDDLFYFLCGYLSALMRRRALMLRQSTAATSPEIIAVETLRRALGRVDDANRPSFPETGAVYLLRQNPDDIEDDELVQSLRDSLIPHTYTLVARVATVEVIPRTDESATKIDVPGLLVWYASFAGTRQATKAGDQETISVAGLMAEAVRARDHLLDRRTLQPADSALRSGFESTEHIVLKSIVLSRLRELYPSEQIDVEKSVSSVVVDEDGALDSAASPDRRRLDRPDIRVGDRLWVEIETLRGLALPGSNPFFELEAKLRQKLKAMASAHEIWLLVPSDVAALAGEQIAAIARNLNHALGKSTVQYGFVDIVTGDAILQPLGDAPAIEPVRFYGTLLGRKQPESQQLRWSDIAGYQDVKQRLHDDILDPLINRKRYEPYGIAGANGVLLYGLPGCGKSLIGQVIAGEAAITCRMLKPSDLTSMWLGEGVMKIRAIFDWALKQAPCVLVLDELDAVAPQRKEGNMHTDEKRQVNELLAQLSRIADQGVIVVGTTNYARGIDTAIQRTGRFDVKLPIFPPDEGDRAAIISHYLSPERLRGFLETESIDIGRLASATTLQTPADLKAAIHTTARRAIRRADSAAPTLTTEDLLDVMSNWPRSIRQDVALDWIEETEKELGSEPKLQWLRDEVDRAYGVTPRSTEALDS